MIRLIDSPVGAFNSFTRAACSFNVLRRASKSLCTASAPSVGADLDTRSNACEIRAITSLRETEAPVQIEHQMP